MDNFDFSENEFSDNDDEFYFFDSPSVKKTEQEDEEVRNKRINDLINNTVTKRKSNQIDFNKIELKNDYELNKQTIKAYLQELFNLVIQVRKKLKSAAGEKKILTDKEDIDDLNDDLNLDENQADQEETKIKSTPAENRLFKKKQEAAYKKIEASLYSEFNKSLDPFYLNLIFIENANDYRVNKYNSLACIIAKSFDKWLSLPENLKLVQEYKFTDELKIDAFIVATRYNLLMIEYISNSYRLTTNNVFLLPFLNMKIKKFDHKDKAILISSLMMHQHFKCEEILLPLLVQDKLNIIDKYLSKAPDQQNQFAQFLDYMCSKDINIATILHQYEIKNIKLDHFTKLNRKNLSKLATRLIKTYLIDASLCPNITNQRFHKNLRYLVYRRYIEQSLTYEPWQELVMECLKNADFLVGNFFDLLAENNDYKEIYIWTKKLNIDLKSLPHYMQSQIANYLQDQSTVIKKDEIIEIDPIEEKFYKLKLTWNKIKLIDKKSEFRNFLDEINELSLKKEFLFVGVDTEWKPTCAMGVNSEELKKVALIQISTNEQIYLIDMISLAETLDDHDSHTFAQKFLYNKKIIKLGYGFTHDIKMLSHSFINIHDIESFRLTVIDLAYLVEQLKRLNFPLFKSFETDSENGENSSGKEKGLSELVRLCFGKPLNKSEQISNWEKRPLRKSQINYAALDAFCLIEIFDYLRDRMVEMKINFDIHKCIGKKFKHTTTNNKEKNDVKKDKNEKSSNLEKIETNFKINETAIKAQDLRLVCDNMLGGLGKELRRCGIDTVILENGLEHTEVAKIARRENRYAISSGMPYNAIRNQLPEGRCIHAINSNAKEQCSHILKMFNVDIQINDLYSRCRSCNSGSFTILTRKQMKSIWFKNKNSTDESNQLSMLSIEGYDMYKDEDLIKKVNLENLTLLTDKNPRIELEGLFESTIEIIDTYYICDGCGHIYWEGPHWNNIRTRFSHVLKDH